MGERPNKEDIYFYGIMTLLPLVPPDIRSGQKEVVTEPAEVRRNHSTGSTQDSKRVGD